MITLSEINEAYRNATPEERQEFLELIIPDLFENPVFKNRFDAQLVTSDLEIPSRLMAVEKVTGTYNFADFEEHEPTLTERIEALEHRTVLAHEKPVEEKKEENPIILTLL